VDLNDVATSILTLFGNDFKNRNIALELRLAHELPRVAANRSRIEQVFTNIILNAADAMAEGGTLTVTSFADAAEVTVRFADTGHGIPEEDLKNVFEPFFTRKRSGKGTGLGLWISHLVIEESNGRLAIESEPDKGTTVSVVLPVMDDPSGARGSS
jgi:signal transduction histidine kinase